MAVRESIELCLNADCELLKSNIAKSTELSNEEFLSYSYLVLPFLFSRTP